MIVTQLHLKNFRCFKQKKIDFSAPITLIKGENGSGKTSILEALYYACYLRSFRTHNARDMIALGEHEFFIRARIATNTSTTQEHDLRIGNAGDKKLVKLDGQAITSFKSLMDHYRVIALFEDDLALVKDGPEVRRIFIDQALLLLNPDKLALFREFRHILDNRNALLKKYQGRPLADMASYRIWTLQLWNISLEVIRVRKELLAILEGKINELLSNFAQELTIGLTYSAKYELDKEDFTLFERRMDALLTTELRFGRSMFGAHLDDIMITYTNKNTRAFVSRGQQKLVVIVLKVALLEQLTQNRGKTLFILDDFMTDFDEQRIETLVNLLAQLNTQLIFTSPMCHEVLEGVLKTSGAAFYTLSD